MSLKFKAIHSYTDTLPLHLLIIYKLICSQGYAWQITVVKYKRNQHSPVIQEKTSALLGSIWPQLGLKRVVWQLFRAVFSMAHPHHILYSSAPPKHCQNILSLCSPKATALSCFDFMSGLQHLTADHQAVLSPLCHWTLCRFKCGWRLSSVKLDLHYREGNN